MKRTLLEVFCGLAALVLMASYHHQIARLEEHQTDITNLERKVDRASANARDLDQMRQEILAQTEGRMKVLEAELVAAKEDSDRAKTIAGLSDGVSRAFNRLFVLGRLIDVVHDDQQIGDSPSGLSQNHAPADPVSQFRSSDRLLQSARDAAIGHSGKTSRRRE